MKLLILGSTGATGRLLITMAISAGHDVRVLVRASTAETLASGAEIMTGDARSEYAVSEAMEGVDKTISALGMGLRTVPNGLMVDAAGALIAGSASTGSDRLIMLSSWGVGETLAKSSPLVRLTYRPGRRVHREKAEAEALLNNSAVNWTLVYPVALTNGPATGHARGRDLSEIDRMHGTPRISRADVTRYMLDVAQADTWQRRTVVVDTFAT